MSGTPRHRADANGKSDRPSVRAPQGITIPAAAGKARPFGPHLGRFRKGVPMEATCSYRLQVVVIVVVLQLRNACTLSILTCGEATFSSYASPQPSPNCFHFELFWIPTSKNMLFCTYCNPKCCTKNNIQRILQEHSTRNTVDHICNYQQIQSLQLAAEQHETCKKKAPPPFMTPGGSQLETAANAQSHGKVTSFLKL